MNRLNYDYSYIAHLLHCLVSHSKAFPLSLLLVPGKWFQVSLALLEQCACAQTRQHALSTFDLLARAAYFKILAAMLRARRNSRLAESLGPPMRFADVETVEKSKDGTPVTSKPPSGGRLPPSSRSRPGKENRYLGDTRERSPISNNRQTPNSTYPASLCGSSGNVKKSVKLVLVGGQTPSSTFPISLPINGASSSQNTRVTEPHTPVPTEQEKGGSVLVEEKATSDHAPSDNTTNGMGAAVSTTAGPSAAMHKSKSVPQHLEAGHSQSPRTEEGQLPAQRSLLPSKLHLDRAMVRHGSEDRGIHAPLSSTAPPGAWQSTDVVTLVSATGERRFKRMKLLGTGGSSKVSQLDFTHTP